MGLFGGSDTTSTVTSEPWEEQQPYLEETFQLADDWYGDGESNVAGFTDNQLTSQQQALDYADGSAGELYDQSNQTLSTLADPQSNEAINQLSSGEVNMDAYNASADELTRRMTDNFNENIIPGISRNNLSSSGIPTSRQGIATQQAATEFNQDLGDQLGTMYESAYTDAQNRQGEGAQLELDSLNSSLSGAQGVQDLGLVESQIYGDVGSEQQQLEQQQIDDEYNQIVQYQNLVDGDYGGTTTSTTSGGSDPTGALVGAAVGGAYGGAQGASVGSSLGGLL